MRKYSLFFLPLLVGVAISACDNTTPPEDYLNAADCTTIVDSTNTYTKSVKAILDNNCAFSGCHNAATKKEGVNLEGYAASKNTFSTNDLVLCSIHHGTGCEPMPKGGSKLSDSDIKKIDCWAKNGYKE
ncbi:MAG: hypothetical protein ACKVTZ_05685 [Bacteroidia bacterium]